MPAVNGDRKFPATSAVMARDRSRTCTRTDRSSSPIRSRFLAIYHQYAVFSENLYPLDDNVAAIDPVSSFSFKESCKMRKYGKREEMKARLLREIYIISVIIRHQVAKRMPRVLFLSLITLALWRKQGIEASSSDMRIRIRIIDAVHWLVAQEDACKLRKRGVD